MKLGLSPLLFFLTLSSITACNADVEPRAVESVTPADWNAALALVSDGEDVYAPRISRLDLLAKDGTQRTIAGVDYAQCPSRDDQRWSATVLDHGYPSFVVHRGRAYLTDPFCGVWSIDLATGQSTSLLEHEYGADPRWGGQPNAKWHATSPIAIAPLGDDLAMCLTIDRFSERFEKKTDEPDRIELWRIGTDGAPKEKLASLDARDEDCTYLLADGETLYLASNHAIHRFDVPAKKLTTLTTDAGTSFGSGLWAFAQDAGHLYFLRAGALERVAKDGSQRSVLFDRPYGLEPARLVLATDGVHVYWIEDRKLWRVPTSGGEAEMIVDGQEGSGLFPSSLVVTSSHVWFQRAVRVPSHSVTDEETGETIDGVTLHFAIERVAK